MADTKVTVHNLAGMNVLSLRSVQQRVDLFIYLRSNISNTSQILRTLPTMRYQTT